MSERRKTTRKTRDRRTVVFGRNGGKFGASVDAAFRAGRKPIAEQLENAGIQPSLKMNATLALIKGEFYVVNLSNRLQYEQFEFGDEVEVTVRLIERPRCKHCHRSYSSHAPGGFCLQSELRFEKEK
jgi:hypothetical protein